MKRISQLLSLNTQQQKLIDIDKPYVVQAGAGSGKTRVLVSRYLQILESGANANEIVAITFTINAASEMKERIRKYIREYIDNFGETKSINYNCFKDIADSPISTIHGFAAAIIRENPYECNLGSRIKILEGLDRKLFVQESVDEFLINKSQKDKNATEIFKNENYNYASVKNKLIEILELTFRHHINIYDLKADDKDLKAKIDKLYKKLSSEIKLGPYGSENNKINTKLKEFHAFINDLGNCELRIDKIKKLSKACQLLSNTASPKGILQLNNSNDLERHFAANCAEIINQIINLIELSNSRSYMDLFLKFYEFYKEKKRLIGYLEFDDLLRICLNLLKNNPDILQEYQNRFRYFLVDEFQDTDDLQYELINLFSSSNHFIVGDPKQSIFGFRGASPEIFKKLQKNSDNSSLTYNYRSDYRLIAFYNELFKVIIKESYQKMEVESEGSTASARVKEILYTNVSKDETRVLVESASISRKVAELLAQGYKCKDIAILLRSKSHISSFESALCEASIPYYSSEQAGFYRYSEIRDIVCMLKYINNKNDRISEASVLRSTFAGVSDTELFNYYVKDKPSELITDYLKFVSQLRDESAVLRPVELLTRILNKTRFWEAMLALADGKRKYDSITKLVELFSQLENQGKSLTEIIHFLDLNYEENTEGLSQQELDESDTVKILTVHKAKGLEFAVVILADINHGMGGGSETVSFSKKDGVIVRNTGIKSKLWKEIEEEQKKNTYEEEKRSLYVAITRAKEKLILSVCPDSRLNKGSYMDILNSVLSLTKIEKDDKILNFKNFKIPVVRASEAIYTIPVVNDDEKEIIYEPELPIIYEIDVAVNDETLNEIDPPDLSIKLNNIQIGSVMHRYLQIWNYSQHSIKSTINYVLNEYFILDPKMEELLIQLSDNYLNSDLFAQIKEAEEIKREFPFYIELDGKHERRKIDLLVFKDDNIFLYDYKLSSEVKPEHIDQMDLYEKALINKYNCNNISKNLVHVPDVIIKNLN